MVPHIINPELIVYLQISLIHDWENLCLVCLKHKNYEYAPWQIKPQHLQFFLLFLLSFRISMKLIFILYFNIYFDERQREKDGFGMPYWKISFFKNSFIAHFASTLLWPILGHIYIRDFYCEIVLYPLIDNIFF